MINVGQVVASVAAGAMLTIAVTLVVQVYGGGQQDLPDSGAGAQQSDDAVGREWRIDTAAQLIEDSFMLLQARTGEQTPPPQERTHTTGQAFLPYGAVEVRRRGHLRLLVFGRPPGEVIAGAAGWLGGTARDPRVTHTGRTLSAAVAVAAIVIAVFGPEQDANNRQGDPPATATTPTSWTMSPSASLGTTAPPGQTPRPGPSVASVTPAGPW
ncbi:hypothetical protein ACFOOM_07785 [Streptomyces echinoruber]|uniref:hypothetical protein n=1 Tax=Streptomyces echinoruber TaxID=68898 RepID=UPI00167C5502|nr:hypothetical protein [Streptomyces echinoruber]